MMPDKVYLEEGCSVPVVGFVSPAWNNPKDKENTVEYIRKEVVEHIIRVALGPQDALNKIRSL